MKIKKILLLCCITVFSFSCVTNPITEDSFDPNAPPPADIYLVPTILIPGLPQIMHGEYLEGFIYFLGSIGSAALVIPNSRMENGAVYPSADGEDSFYFFTGLAAGFYGLGIIDAAATSVIRNSDWDRLNRIRIERGYPFSKRLDGIMPGMSGDEIAGLLGRPAVRQETAGADSPDRERWLYQNLKEEVILIFEDGLLTEIDYPYSIEAME